MRDGQLKAQSQDELGELGQVSNAPGEQDPRADRGAWGTVVEVERQG
jgi:hypothetical protein